MSSQNPDPKKKKMFISQSPGNRLLKQPYIWYHLVVDLLEKNIIFHCKCNEGRCRTTQRLGWPFSRRQAELSAWSIWTNQGIWSSLGACAYHSQAPAARKPFPSCLSLGDNGGLSSLPTLASSSADLVLLSENEVQRAFKGDSSCSTGRDYSSSKEESLRPIIWPIQPILELRAICPVCSLDVYI